MKPADITIDMPIGEAWDAVHRGDFTEAELLAQMPRLRREGEARQLRSAFAVVTVRESEARKVPRKDTWTVSYLIFKDGWQGFLVKCGRAAWHVTDADFSIKRVH